MSVVEASMNILEPSITPTLKKRKRKMTYKEMMKNAMTCNISEEEDTKNHEQKLANSLGGGQFKKIDKI